MVLYGCGIGSGGLLEHVTQLLYGGVDVLIVGGGTQGALNQTRRLYWRPFHNSTKNARARGLIWTLKHTHTTLLSLPDNVIT